MEKLKKSVFGLIKNNCGYFKSQKQADFFNSLEDNFIGVNEAYGNSVAVFFECDEEGITKVYNSNNKVKWERTQKNIEKFNKKQKDKPHLERLNTLQQRVYKLGKIKDNLSSNLSEILKNKQYNNDTILNFDKKYNKYLNLLDETNKEKEQVENIIFNN